MKNSLLIIVSLLLLICTKANSQSYFYAVFPGDTIILTMYNPSGTIQWEETDDTVSGAWMPIPGAVGNNFQYILPSLTGRRYIRAEITNPVICDMPYYGSTLKLRVVLGSSQIMIGDYFSGGIVFYKYPDGSGMVVSPGDIAMAEWGCYGVNVSALSPAFGSGQSNTLTMLANSCDGAAYVCDTLNYNGYSDWFLPSVDELDSIYVNLNSIGYYNFAHSADPYWSSVEYSANDAKVQYFGTGSILERYKNIPALVRAVRYFSAPPTVQQRLDAGETPKQIFESGQPVDSLYGRIYEGGLIFYLDVVNGNGMVAAPADQSPGAEWGCMSTIIPGADATVLGTGLQNTIDITNGCFEPGIAADLCYNYTDGTYYDWYLPSADELDSMYVNLFLKSYGGFASDTYWSSSENSSDWAWYYSFTGSGVNYSGKNASYYVRAIRAFSGDILTVQQRLDNGETPLQIFESGTVKDSLYGKIFQGGYIFSFDQNSGMCYMASISDQGTGTEWGCSGYYFDQYYEGFGTGGANTSIIINGCATPGIAARLCDEYTDGTHSDWFMPSRYELDSMYTNLTLRGLANLSPSDYWSSTQAGFQDAYYQNFSTGTMNYGNKSNLLSVRAVRVYYPPIFAGGSGTAVDPWLIANLKQLNNVRLFCGPGHCDKSFKQIANIDLNIAPYNQGEGWVPIGTYVDDMFFGGNYNGAGHTINGLFINRIDWDQALFGWTAGARIDSLGMLNVDITGDQEAGGLVAWADSTYINECYGNGNVTATSAVGGLFGYFDNNSTIVNCHFSGNVICSSYQAGGLAGKIIETDMINCYSTGTVFSSGSSDAGGLIANAELSGIIDSYSLSSVQATGGGNVFNGGLIGIINDSCYVNNCFSIGDVSGEYHTGGFIGYIERYSLIMNSYCTGNVTCTNDWNGGFTSWSHGTIKNCYCTGSVSGGEKIGGFIGISPSSCIIENCYSTGNPSGINMIGGFVGSNESSVRIKNCYSTGTVTGSTNKGGFVGASNVQNMYNCFWDTASSGISTSYAGIGRPTYAMVREISFSNWDFSTVWSIDEPNSYPYLQWQGAPGTFNIPVIINQNYVMDIDTNFYPTVLIGTQTWMASNLKVRRLNDGTPIPLIDDAPTWASTYSNARCWYNNDSLTNAGVYGALYNWFVVQSGNVCPSGWHVPDNAELDLLLTNVGGALIASNALRETGIVHWQTPNTGATNSFGFTAIGTGLRWYFDGSYTLKGTLCRIHSSTIFDTSNAYNYLISSESPDVTIEYKDNKMGCTIRCIKD